MGQFEFRFRLLHFSFGRTLEVWMSAQAIASRTQGQQVCESRQGTQYHFVRTRVTLRVTPAMAAGIISGPFGSHRRRQDERYSQEGLGSEGK